MKKALFLLIAGAAISGLAAYAASARNHRLAQAGPAAPVLPAPGAVAQ
ncbi:hypothetical protein [Sphingomonas sp. SCN 67-18]|nr:hypothetical protein [Sphingomonas sp. SCN 67-18]